MTITIITNRAIPNRQPITAPTMEPLKQ